MNKKPKPKKSALEHWWLDEEIKRPEPQQEDWDFSPLKDSLQERQLPWAWQYECWREWQPWSDFKLWRQKDKEWLRQCHREHKSDLKDIVADRKRQLDEVKEKGSSDEWIADIEEWAIRQKAGADFMLQSRLGSSESRLPIWILRDFADYFPDTPWLRIPLERRRTLKPATQPGSAPIPLEGSLLTLKDGAPEENGTPFDSEYVARYRAWLEAPGHYRREDVREIPKGSGRNGAKIRLI